MGSASPTIRPAAPVVLTCWCGAPATYAEHTDPAVTPSSLVLPDGSPGTPRCDAHPGILGGYRLAAPLDPDYEDAVTVTALAPGAPVPWWEPSWSVDYAECTACAHPIPASVWDAVRAARLTYAAGWYDV
jgi:hypothetical protein